MLVGEGGAVQRVVQISDCHLFADKAQEYRGANSWEALGRLLPSIHSWQPQLIVASGDLSEDESEASYTLFRELLEPLQIPVACLPGNHDDRQLMQQFLTSGLFGMPNERQLGLWRLFFMDSKATDGPHGRLGQDQLERLRQALQASTQPSVIFLHHQPLPVGSPRVDKVPLLEPTAFLDLVQQYAQVRCVAWGHIHHTFRRETDRRLWLGCPATSINSKPGTSEFMADRAGPRCRWFKLHADGRMASGLLSEASVCRISRS